MRTSYSQILNSTHDFSTALADTDGQILVAQAEHVPIHVGGLPWAVLAVRDAFAGHVKPGDVFLLNDPYHGGNHLPDVTVFIPVFAGDQQLFWVINRSHQSDIGGGAAGAYNAQAVEIWQEGLRIAADPRERSEGYLRNDIIGMLAANVRHARDFEGDIAAMIGSARVGERRVRGLIDEYGVDTVVAAIDVSSIGGSAVESVHRDVERRRVLRRIVHRRRRARRARHPDSGEGRRRAMRLTIDLSDCRLRSKVSSTLPTPTRARRSPWRSPSCSTRRCRRIPGPFVRSR